MSGGFVMENIASFVICGIFIVVCLITSILQFNEKGFLLNNACIFASKEEREKMDRKPYYRQSAIVFALLTAFFSCIELEMVIKTGWLFWAECFIMAVALIYSIVSSVKMSRLSNRK